MNERLQRMTKAEARKLRTRLRRAKGKLVNVGWVKEYYRAHDEYGHIVGYCAVGALPNISPTTLEVRLLADAVPKNSLARRRWTAGRDIVMSYNDHPARRKEQVLALYDRAIDQVELRLAQSRGGK